MTSRDLPRSRRGALPPRHPGARVGRAHAGRARLGRGGRALRADRRPRVARMQVLGTARPRESRSDGRQSHQRAYRREARCGMEVPSRTLAARQLLQPGCPVPVPVSGQLRLRLYRYRYRCRYRCRYRAAGTRPPRAAVPILSFGRRFRKAVIQYLSNVVLTPPFGTRPESAQSAEGTGGTHGHGAPRRCSLHRSTTYICLQQASIKHGGSLSLTAHSSIGQRLELA